MEFISDIPWWIWIILVLVLVAIRDVFFNRRHTITHNFPIVGHFRYILETIGPELRQYIVANNREELPFTRSQRTWIYSSAKKENNYRGFGTDMDQYAPNFTIVKPALLPFAIAENHISTKEKSFIPCAKVIGLYNERERPFRPNSIINISAMSFGSLSGRAVESMNKGAIIAGCYHNTGEGGLSSYHSYGADVVFHFGTGYFGVRDSDGHFSLEKLKDLVKANPFIRAIEVKLSQGAKPGKGGVLPGKKITAEIAGIRGVKIGKDVLSPARHTAFSTVEQLMSFIEELAEATGLPVGIKSAVGRLKLWEELADIMVRTNRGPDFIAIDGGEGGTGAAPPAFADHVSLPFVYAFTRIYKLFKERELTHRIVFVGAGKLGLPASAVTAFAMGVDIINVARESMMSIGCIQAQLCHTNHCPSGVATQNKWLQKGIDIKLKSLRFSNYIKSLRKEVLEISHACGYEHPAQINMRDVVLTMGDNNYTKSLEEGYGYQKAEVPFVGMQELWDCQYLGKRGEGLK